MKVVIIYVSLFSILLLWSCKENSNPYGINEGFPSMDYDSAISKTQQNGKSILIYFNSIGCVNCRKVENEIIHSSRTLKKLKENYQFINLYVDDRIKLDSSKWVKAPSGRYYDNRGEINATIQRRISQTGSQPTFCIFDSNLNLLHSYGYAQRDSFYKRINQSK